MQKIAPSLWFDKNCDEALRFYTSLFKNSKIISIERYPEDQQVGPIPDMAGKVLTAIFELEGQRFMALDGGPYFKFNPSVSFFVNFDPATDTNAQENIDQMWLKLAKGGKVMMELAEYPFSQRYGWVQDKYGVSWQLILSDPNGEPRPPIMPSLLFSGAKCGQAQEAIDFYLSVFKNARQGTNALYLPGQSAIEQAKTAYADFQLEGFWLAAMDSGVAQDFDFNEAISFYVECQDQTEVDYYWQKLSAVPESEQCGWLKDKFGISWQIVPKQLGEMMSDPDKEKAGRVLQSMLQMKKISIAVLEKAYRG